MTVMIFDNLTPRQQAYRDLCEHHGIVIGDTTYSGGEDAADYFAVRTDDGEVVGPCEPVERFCVVTCAGDFTYAYPGYKTLEAAKDKALENITDSIYAEYPVEIVDLDTNQCWVPTITATWRLARS